MMRHWLSSHSEVDKKDMKFSFEIKQYHIKPMTRMLQEAIMIRRNERNPKKTVMNSRMEYSRTVLPRETDPAQSLEEECREKEIDEEIDKIRMDEMKTRRMEMEKKRLNKENMKRKVNKEAEANNKRQKREFIRKEDVENIREQSSRMEDYKVISNLK